MDATDCYEIGLAAYNEEDYYHSILWMEEANERYYLLEKESSEINKSDILNILSISLYKQGNLKRALIINDKLIELDPLYPNATNNSKLYEQELLANGVVEEDFRINIPPLNNYRSLNDSYIGSVDYQVYEELCRGEKEINITQISKLYCYYKVDRPFLRLAPIKVEIIRFEPLAVIFRNVVYDEEIEIMQNVSLPKLNRSSFQDPITGDSYLSKYRISKNAWINIKTHPIIKQIVKRLKLMTNLNMKSAEPLQVANYGIGGYTKPHFDSFKSWKSSNFTLEIGDRIATLLFYLTTPEKGGYTVFTDIKTIAKPTKNDALFWYNLWRSGDGDLRARHAACPVLLGEKWFTTTWMHEKGQEFFRPCGLVPLIQERYVGDLGGPEPKKYPNISPYCKEKLYCE
uniref:Fe2OG dioxygenase domain-containing protein n=1 Tax=Meloidogyne incognita TaxID=6306 RepID=A0A914KV50_MELIC